ncbi:amidohydrolase [Chloroflexi bacterium TSY]|nr:amidohydrolase [Chloroflexi bacterium TSY]
MKNQKMTSLTFTSRVPVFDANVRVGDRHDEPAPFRDRTALLAEMDRHGVARALVYHALTEFNSPIEGNELLEEWLGDDGRLLPQWSIVPTEESLAQIQSLHADGRMMSVRLHDTNIIGLPFRPWAYDPMLTWLSENRVPLWIPLPDVNADDLVTTLQAYPHLRSVIVGAHYVHALWVRPLLKALPNAYLELSRYETIGEIEALCQEFGPQRFLYGSWYPRYAMGPMLFYLHHTNLTSEELTLVCAENLDNMIGGST